MVASGLIVEARRYRTGHDEPEEVRVEDPDLRQADDEQLLWVDIETDLDRSTDRLSELDERLCLGGALVALADGREIGIRFTRDVICMTVAAIADDDGTVLPVQLLASPNLVVSVHGPQVPDLDRPIRIVANDPRFGRLDAGTFLGILLDGLMDGYHAGVEAIEVDIDELDTRALEDRGLDDILDDIVALRRRIGNLRRSLAPQREVFAALVRPATGDDPSPVGWPWPGLGARFERVLDGIENAREELIGTFDLVSTRTGQRTNDVMRVLTVVSSLLLPSVVIAGIMGMNFKEPFFDQASNFFLVLALMGALSVSILVVARNRRWL